VTIFGQNSQQEPLPECDQETTGNPFALSDEVKSNEMKVNLEEITIGWDENIKIVRKYPFKKI